MSDVLGCWVELENFVQVFVVDVIVDELLDKGEVTHESVAVKFLGLAIDLYNPVVSVQVLALALIVKIELVA
jgi:hypothetical protein